MGTVMIPNLVFENALKFCSEFDNYVWDGENEFDFGAVKNCDPFPMLIVGQKIKEGRATHSDSTYTEKNLNSSYANTMRFYRFIGLDKGKPMDINYGNQNYQPISDLHLFDLVKESREKGVPLGELVTITSRKLAKVLSRSDNRMKETMTFCLREIIRNIPEHSLSYHGWYCAQYWPSYDLVELAILDDGRGILQSINSNYTYACEGLSNKDAIKKAMQPGISCKFDDSGNEEIFANSGSKWKNSGYGLFVVSRICAKTGGSFVLASGDTAVLVDCDNKKELKYSTYATSIQGTAIRIRLKVSGISRINAIMDEINEEGRHNCPDGFKTASKASSFYFKE